MGAASAASRWARLASLALLASAAGCFPAVSGDIGGSRSAPPPSPVATDPPPPGSPGVPDEPARNELRGILVGCREGIERTQGRVHSAQRRDRATAAAAGLAAAAGMTGDRIEGEDSDIPTGMGGERACNRAEDPQLTGCREGQTTPSAPVGDVPATPGTEKVETEAGEQLGSVADTMNAIDDMLDDEPDTSKWTPQQWERWDRLTDRLRGQCRELRERPAD